MRIPDTEKLNMGYSRGIVLGYNCESRKNPDICESLQVRLIDIDIQPEIEVFAPLPKGKIMGLSRASKSENPIGKEVHVCYKYNVGYQEYVYGNLISEDEVENVKILNTKPFCQFLPMPKSRRMFMRRRKAKR